MAFLSKLKKHSSQYPIDIAALVIFMLAASISYSFFNRPFGQVRSLAIGLDFKLPLIKELIIVYFFYFVMIPLTALVCMLDDRTLYKRFLFTMILARLGAYFIYYKFQTVVPTYDLNRLGHDIFSRLLYLTYTFDGRYAAAPSLHVCDMLICSFFLSKSKLGKFRKNLYIAFMILIALTTVPVKQHVLADVPIGVLHAAFFILISQPACNFLTSFKKNIEPDSNSI